MTEAEQLAEALKIRYSSTMRKDYPLYDQTNGVWRGSLQYDVIEVDWLDMAKAILQRESAK